jgi:hypothetical protein
MKNPFKKLEAKILNFLFIRLVSNEYADQKIQEMMYEAQEQVQAKFDALQEEHLIQNQPKRVYGFVRYD